MSVALVILNEISNSFAAELPPPKAQVVKKSTKTAKGKTAVSKSAKVSKKGVTAKKTIAKPTPKAKNPSAKKVLPAKKEATKKVLAKKNITAKKVLPAKKEVVQKVVPAKKSLVKPAVTKSIVVKKALVSKAIATKKHPKKEVVQQVNYSEESVVKDSRLNIYTGNPGYYATLGDTAYFGNIPTLSDSAFIQAQRTIIPVSTKPYGKVGKERIAPSQDWVLGLILVLWIIFASVTANFPKYLDQIFLSLVNFKEATRLFRQRGYKMMFGAVRLDLIFHLVLPLSVFQIAQFFNVSIGGYPSIVLFIGMAAVINTYLFLKILLNKLVGSITMVKEQTKESLFNISLHYRALGFILLPLVTIHAILPITNFITIWIMAVLLVILHIAAVIRTIYLAYQKEISIFYLILYLCTLEILPLLLIFKLIVKQ